MKYTKKFVRIIPVLAAALLIFAAQSALAVGVRVNGSEVKFSASDGAPFIENGRTLVPLRAAAEACGAAVSYDAEAGAAIIVKDGVTVTVPIGSSYVYRNGEPIKNDVAAQIADSRTYLPIRVVMEAFGAEVGWDSASSSVTVDDPDVLFVSAIENGAEVSKATVWNKWSNAMAKQSDGDYSGAIAVYKEVAPRFMSEGVTNMALLFQHLGECYGALGEYHSAAVCYSRSAYYWRQVSGQEQTALHYENLASYVDTDVRLYLKTDDESYSRAIYFGAPNENKSGILLGTTYNSDTAELTGIGHGLELQYFEYGDSFERHDSYYFKPARENGTVLEIAWQPTYGLDEVQENDYLIEQAKYLESTGCSILLRFANEMNDETCAWYTPDYNKYIEKFRLVARVFRQYAPSVALVWAPNFYPPDTVDLYYPGDEYVDFVGLSVYEEYTPENDPLGEGIERSRWSSILDRVYETYGSRKPIIVAEGGCSYVNIYTRADISDFAVSQMRDYYTYLPIKYPNLKMVVLFNKEDSGGREFLLSENPPLAEAYRQGISSSGRYISELDEEAAEEYYYELHNNFSLPAKNTELCSYITSPISDFDYVIYEINGVSSTAYAIPYAASVDLSPYAGQTVELTVRAYKNGVSVVEKTFKIQVE